MLKFPFPSLPLLKIGSSRSRCQTFFNVSTCVKTRALADYEDTTSVYAKLFFLLRKAVLLEAQSQIPGHLTL